MFHTIFSQKPIFAYFLCKLSVIVNIQKFRGRTYIMTLE